RAPRVRTRLPPSRRRCRGSEGAIRIARNEVLPRDLEPRPNLAHRGARLVVRERKRVLRELQNGPQRLQGARRRRSGQVGDVRSFIASSVSRIITFMIVVPPWVALFPR